MARPRKAGDLTVKLAPERVLRAVETLVAMAACYAARPLANQLPFDDELAKGFADIVDRVERRAKEQTEHAEGVLAVQLREALVEAYRPLAGKKSSKRRSLLAPGNQLDHMVNWVAGGEVLARGRIQAAWQRYSFWRYGEVWPVDEEALDYLVSKKFLVKDAVKPGMGPVDLATRAAQWLQESSRTGDGVGSAKRLGAAQKHTGLAARNPTSKKCWRAPILGVGARQRIRNLWIYGQLYVLTTSPTGPPPPPSTELCWPGFDQHWWLGFGQR